MSDLAEKSATGRGVRLTAVRKPRRLRILTLLTIATILLGSLWLLGLVWFAGKAAAVPRGGAIRTDVIIVLTGGSERIATGLDLLAQSRAERLFISGVDPGVDLEALLAVVQRPPSPLDDRITIGHRAADTVGNAAEAASWMRRHGYQSLQLVTANYHMPRSLLAFRALLPGIDIHPHPVRPANVHLDDWWRWPGTTRLLISEYNKYLLSYLQFIVAEHSTA